LFTVHSVAVGLRESSWGLLRSGRRFLHRLGGFFSGAAHIGGSQCAESPQLLGWQIQRVRVGRSSAEGERRASTRASGLLFFLASLSDKRRAAFLFRRRLGGSRGRRSIDRGVTFRGFDFDLVVGRGGRGRGGGFLAGEEGRHREKARPPHKRLSVREWPA
jgi:hypothetical protein